MSESQGPTDVFSHISGKQETGLPKFSALCLRLLCDTAVDHLLLLGYRLLPRRQCADTGAVGIASESPSRGKEGFQTPSALLRLLDSLNLCLLFLMLMLLYGTKASDVLEMLLFYITFGNVSH